MDTHSLLHATLLKARRRRFIGIFLAEMGSALAVVAALLCVLLLAGAQVLSAVAVVLLAGAGTVFLAWRLRTQWLDVYRTAQELDRTWGLPDTLSTACHYEQSQLMSDARLAHLGPLIERQQQDAVEVLRSNTVHDAFPLHLGRVHLVALLVCTAAFALFGYRYFQSESLDLRDQLASLRIPFIDNEDGPPALLADNDRYRPEPERKRSPIEDYNPDYDPSRERLDGTYNDMPPVTGINVSDSQPGEGSEEGNLPTDSTMDMRNEMAADPRRQQGGSKDGAERGEGDKNQAKNNDSLFDKFQQAMNNMMDKFANRQNDSMEQRGEKGNQQQAQNAGEQKGDGSDDTSDREGNQKSDNPQGSENAKDGMGGQQAQDMGKQNAGSNEAASDSPASVGAEDGAKDLAAARQLEAMGQIAEILGQRSEQVKGEMKVEVEAQKEQSLTTALRNVRATHRDTGGEMSRDEVPLRLQNYVKEYLKAAREAEAAGQGASRNR
ncbi:MAG: hypothetical protein KIT83_10125 [Bryobacterales bacterium]|nr:hypothetical protein [Bryobacterales bacterium]